MANCRRLAAASALVRAADADTRTLRGPPLTPEAFGALLELKTFTNGKSDRALVASLYAQTASAVIKDAVILKCVLAMMAV